MWELLPAMEPSWARSAREDDQGHRPREDRVAQ